MKTTRGANPRAGYRWRRLFFFSARHTSGSLTPGPRDNALTSQGKSGGRPHVLRFARQQRSRSVHVADNGRSTRRKQKLAPLNRSSRKTPDLSKGGEIHSQIPQLYVRSRAALGHYHCLGKNSVSSRGARTRELGSISSCGTWSRRMSSGSLVQLYHQSMPASGIRVYADAVDRFLNKTALAQSGISPFV
jgi:hypothetical protein